MIAIAQASTRQQTSVDLAAVKGRQQAAWSTGDYAVIGGTLVIVAENLCDAVDIRAGQRVVDVATGSGNTAIAAARYWCDVTGIDYVPSLLDRARKRAAAEQLIVKFEEGDAENLPCSDGQHDVVLSTFGVMFAPNQEQAARELLRVCKRVERSAWLTGRPKASLGRCSASSANMCRHPRA